MIETVKNWCDKHHLLEYDDNILLACSGGPDSLALVDIFSQLQPIYNLNLAVGHLDHMFRGQASADDAAFVERFCRERGIVCYLEKVDVADYAAKHSLSAEEAARLVRYDFLRKTAVKFGNAKIATGHHRDDQAETVLLHLLRGAGSTGIAGIRPQSCGIIRPLLANTRHEIEAYCQQRHLAVRIDATNLEPCCTRNKIRLLLLPELERSYNPAVKDSLCRSAELVGVEHDFVHNYAEQLYHKLASSRDNDVIQFELDKFAQLHLALQREILRLALEKLRGNLKGISFYHIEKAVAFMLEGRTGTTLELPGNLRLIRKAHVVQMVIKRNNTETISKALCPVEIKVPGKTVISELSMVVETAVYDTYQQPIGKNEIVCDLSMLQLPLYLRSRQVGDRFYPVGLNGSKKIKDFFIDAKIDRDQRDKIPLLCDQHDIIWIVGLRQAAKGKVTSKTDSYVLMRFSQAN